MTHATEIIQQYRLALRHIWNSHFWGNQGPSFRDWESVRDFEKLKLPIYEALVARRLEPLGAVPKAVFGNAFRVVPPATSGQMSMIQIETVGGQWSPFSGPFQAGDVNLILLDFFDWDLLNWRDFRYYLVRVDAFEGRPEAVGRQGLVDVLDSDVVWNWNDAAMHISPAGQ